MEGSLKLIIEYGVIGFLILLSVIVVAFAIERMMTYSTIDIGNFKTREDLEIELTKNLTFIYTVAANAVYIGLLGTVLGIMLTFSTMGEGGTIDAKTIMSSLSYTLVATAVGLVVAIPAMTFYNMLSRKVEVLLARWDARYGRQA